MSLRSSSSVRALLARLAFFAAGALPLASAAADLAIMPVSVHLDAQRDRTTVQITNNGRGEVLLQADAIAWRREGGVDIDQPSSDLIVNPPVFSLAPGKTQIVRVGLRRLVAADVETTYRMVLREVPAPEPADDDAVRGNVRVLVTLRVPVYVAPSAVRREERWQARYDDDGRLVARVANRGNVHYKVGAVRVQGDDVGRTVVTQGAESVLFPGEERVFRLDPAATREGATGNPRPLTLEVLTDRGIQHVALDLPPRR